MPHLRRDGHVFVLDLGDPTTPDTENRFTPEWVSAFDACLDEVEGSSGPAALVTTGTGKFYSNGFEPERFVGPPEEAVAYVASVQRIWARLLAFPMVTVAALQGHTFAGGVLLALAHDQRVMRADRGYLRLPEISLGIPFPPVMSALVLAKSPVAAAHEAMTTGRRYAGPDALAAGLVDATAGESDLLAEATSRAAPHASLRGPTMAAIKESMYGSVLDGLLGRRREPGVSDQAAVKVHRCVAVPAAGCWVSAAPSVAPLAVSTRVPDFGVSVYPPVVAVGTHRWFSPPWQVHWMTAAPPEVEPPSTSMQSPEWTFFTV